MILFMVLIAHDETTGNRISGGVSSPDCPRKRGAAGLLDDFDRGVFFSFPGELAERYTWIFHAHETSLLYRERDGAAGNEKGKKQDLTPYPRKDIDMNGPDLEIIKPGDESGNDMIVKIRLSSGREIFAFPTRNTYSEEWDLGPTWNYVVLGDKPFLVDTGNKNKGKPLLRMMEQTGLSVDDLDFVLISHGHEDHDGGLTEIVDSAGEKGVAIKAHAVYERLIRIYPSQTPAGLPRGFPASCWHCPMPESFTRKYCLEYHKDRCNLEIDCISEPATTLDNGVEVFHTPGHCPDAVAVLLDSEAMLVGDTILPDITPHPSQEYHFELTKDVLPEEYVEAHQLYGLRAYIRSLNRLRKIAEPLGDLLVLPAHRLFYAGTWQHPNLSTRIEGLTDHHIKRCADILNIIKHEPKTFEQISREYFEPDLLKGVGINMAKNEAASHCELLHIAGDAMFVEDDGIVAIGTNGRFESLVRGLEDS